MQLQHVALARVDGGEPGQQLIEGEDVGRRLAVLDVVGLQRDRGRAAAALVALLAAGVVDQHVAHLAGGDRKEMRAILPVDRRSDQAQAGLVQQLRGVEGDGAFAAQMTLGQSVQVAVDQRHQTVQRARIAVAPLAQQLRDRRLFGCVHAERVGDARRRE